MNDDTMVTITVRASSVRTAIAALHAMALIVEKPENRRKAMDAYSDLNEARRAFARFDASVTDLR